MDEQLLSSPSHRRTATNEIDVRVWIRTVLKLAGIYNLVWGTLVILFPTVIFRWSGLPDPIYPSIVQCLGMVIGVYGIGYWIAATNPSRHWPIVLVGLLGKIFGPIGFLYAAGSGQLPWYWGWVILTNDVIWWVPFVIALWYAFRDATDLAAYQPELALETVLQDYVGSRGRSLQQISERNPTMVVFVRHVGCTFCREMLADLAAVQKKAAAAGVELAVVHMSSPLTGRRMLDRFGLEGVHHFSDPQCLIYRAFGVPRGSFQQLFSPPIWWRGFISAFINRHGLGRLDGDGFRMPAVFLLRDGNIIARRMAPRADFHPDYDEIFRFARSADRRLTATVSSASTLHN